MAVGVTVGRPVGVRLGVDGAGASVGCVVGEGSGAVVVVALGEGTGVFAGADSVALGSGAEVQA